jgi:hypothetical protein
MAAAALRPPGWCPGLAAINVVATTTDLAALVAAVGGNLVAVESIVPPGVDPEAFEPRPATSADCGARTCSCASAWVTTTGWTRWSSRRARDG